MSERTRETRTVRPYVSEPTAEYARRGEGISVPTTSVVDYAATVDDLGIPFDDGVEERILAEVEAAELPPELETVVQDDGVLGDRELLSWKWVWYVCNELLTLECVADEYRQEASEAKTLVAIYVTLVDDVAERLGDRTTFWEVAKTAYPETEPDWERQDVDSDYVNSIHQVWTELVDRLRSAPRFEAFVDPFMFNLRQTVQAMEYTRLSDEYPAFMNTEETWYFDTQAIGSFLYWTVDLMFSPAFEMSDFRAFRQIVYELQHMWRLGNWITTWEGEVYEHDFSAGIFVEAINSGIVDERDFERVEAGEMDPEWLIGRIKASGIVEQFIADWKRRRNRLYERDFGMDSLDGDEMVGMMEELMQSHFATSDYR